MSKFGKRLNTQTRGLVYNVFEFLKKEKKTHNLLYNIVQCTSEATGVSYSTIKAIIKEYKDGVLKTSQFHEAGTPLNVQARELIFNISEFLRKERKAQKLNYNIVHCTSEATGVCKSTVWNIITEFKGVKKHLDALGGHSSDSESHSAPKKAVPLSKEKDDNTPEVSQDNSENLPLSVDIKEEPDSVSIPLSSTTDTATEPGCSNWNTDNASKQPSSNISNPAKTEQPSSTAPPPKPPVADKICRLCMSVDGLFGIYDRVSVLRDLSSKIVEVCAIPIYEEDGLPQLICKKCFLSVQNFYDFKVQCAVTDVTLKAELGKELLGSFGKRRGQITEFQKLNMRMKANLQSFYDLVDAINELQDKVELTLSNMLGTTPSLTKPKCKDVVQSTGRKRKADEAVSESSQSPSTTLDKPFENNTPDTSTSQSMTTDSVSSSDLITNSVLNIKTEPEPDPDDEPEPDLGTLFVSNIDGSLLKVEVDEELESDSAAHTDYSESFIPEEDNMVYTEQGDEQMDINEENDNVNSYDNG